jgi:CHAT domain-containing protein/tetratricopeptide (TPR) repeat protein
MTATGFEPRSPRRSSGSVLSMRLVFMLALAAAPARADELKQPPGTPGPAADLAIKEQQFHREAALQHLEPARRLARECLELSQKIVEASKTPEERAQARMASVTWQYRLAQTSIALRDLEQAVPMLDQVLAELRELIPDDRGGYRADCLNELGVARLHRREFNQARDRFEEALAGYKAYKGDAAAADVLDAQATCENNIGTAWLGLEDDPRALEHFDNALKLFEKVGKADNPVRAICLDNRGLIPFKRGENARALADFAEARAIFERAHPEKEFPQGHFDLMLALDHEGEALRRTGDFKKARDTLTRALGMTMNRVETLASYESESQAIAYASTLVPPPRNALLSLPRGPSDTAEQVYAEVWRSKAAVTRVVELRQKVWAESDDPAVRADGKRYEEVRAELSRLSDALPVPVPPAFRDYMNRRSREKEKLEANLIQRLPAFADRVQQARRKHTGLVDSLPVGSVFVDLIRYGTPGERGSKYAAFVLARGKAVERVELGDEASIEEKLNAWHADIRGWRQGTAEDWLRTQVWEPLERAFPKDTKTVTVIIAPDGVFTRLPWSALPGKERGKRLIDAYTTLTTPSGPALLDRLTPPNPRKSLPGGTPGRKFLTVGGVPDDNTPPGAPSDRRAAVAAEDRAGTQDFLDDVAKLALPPGMVRVSLSGRDATTENVRTALKNASRVYFAAHGFFRAPDQFTPSQAPSEAKTGPGLEQTPVFPDRLGPDPRSRNPLVLSGLKLSDGDLTAEMIAATVAPDLDLTVLAACSTGLGAVAPGEGVFGLQRAFHLAGARNVVASLWYVPLEASRVLMNEFHKNLSNTSLSPAEALRLAKLTLRDKGPGQSVHPIFWAAWVASGDPVAPAGPATSPVSTAPPAGPAPSRAPATTTTTSLTAICLGAALALVGAFGLLRRRPPTESNASHS